MFAGSIADNIRYGRLDAADHEVRAAAQVANAHEFTERFPQGYDTFVGERGVQVGSSRRCGAAPTSRLPWVGFREEGLGFGIVGLAKISGLWRCGAS